VSKPGSPPRILVVGGGITGLASAYELTVHAPEIETLLVEERERLGGNVLTVRRDGFLLDGGPDSFLRTKPAAAELCRELGLGDELVEPLPSASRVYVVHSGELVPLPAGMALAVPTRLRPLMDSPLLGWWGKLRILGDLFIETPAEEASDQSVAAFLLRHFGRQATERLAGPLLGGIFAGDIEHLSMRSTFPQLIEIERRHGSLIRGLFAAESRRAQSAATERLSVRDDPLDPRNLVDLVRWLQRARRAPVSPFMSLRRGMGTLVDALAHRLPARAVNTQVGLRELRRCSDARWEALLSDGRRERFDAVVACLPAHAAARVLGTDPVKAELSAIPYVSTATVFFAVDNSRLKRPLDGSGFIVPRSEGRLLASTWVSSKWPNRAPEGMALVRVFLGGAREPQLLGTSGDDDLVAIATAELERLLGPLGSVLFTQVFRWPLANPQPLVGHRDRVARVRDWLAAAPGVYLAGSAYEGVGISDCIRQGRSAAWEALCRVRAAV